MARLLLVLLAVLTAGIGLFVPSPEAAWLYAGAGALVVGAIGLWLRDWYRAKRRDKRRTARSEAAAEADDLRSLGIMDIRPSGAKKGERGAVKDETRRAPESPEAEPSQEPFSEEATDATMEESSPLDGTLDHSEARETTTPSEDDSFEEPASSEAGDARDARGGSAPDEPETSDRRQVADASLERRSEAQGALARALRLATGARAVCLLTQEELALEYRIDAADADGEAPALRETGDVFSTPTALLSAGAAGRDVTLRMIGREEGLAPGALGYYRDAETALSEETTPEAVALVPISLPDDPATRFLLLDGPQGTFERQETLLKRFAGLFSQMLAPPRQTVSAMLSNHATEGGGEPQAGASQNGRHSDPQADGEHRPDERTGDGEEGGSPRPRREIVEEEMRRAENEGHPLALALVYLNRAEMVAERGEEEVGVAERALRARLRQATDGEGRVERFGELTYGVFLSSESTEAERWAIDFQEELAHASDPLEGGVSVGLALMRGPEQSAQALRENATNALREAYTTGTCTVLE